MDNTIKELHMRFCDEALFIRNFRPSTIKWYKESLRGFLKYHQDDMVDIKAITAEKLRQYLYFKRLNGKWSADSFLNQYKGLKSFLKWCVTNGYLEENPIVKIEKPKLEKKLPKRITKQEAERILEYSFNFQALYRFERYRNRAIFAIMLYAGLRSNEAMTLKMGDVDLLNRVINIQLGKGAKDRIVPISGKLTIYLREYLEDRKRLKKDCLNFFVTLRGNRAFTVNGLKKVVEKIKRETNIVFSPHRLRHTFATLMLEGGCDLFSLQKMMGHSDIKTTTIYLSASVEMLQKQMLKHPLG